MEAPTILYDAATRVLTVTDSYPPDDLTGAQYGLVALSYSGALPVLLGVSEPGSASVAVKVLDGALKLVFLYFAEAPAVASAGMADDASGTFRVLANGELHAHKRALYVSHAGSPHPLGRPFRAYLKSFSREYEVAACFAEGNYLLANRLLTVPQL